MLIPAADRGGIIQTPRDWMGASAYEFWLGTPGDADITTTAAAATPSGLNGWGWITTSVGIVLGGTGDFLSAADLDPGYYQLTGASDLLRSPVLFGDYEGGVMASRFLGYMPTTLVLEARVAWGNIASNNTTTFFGFANASIIDAAAAGSGACITCDATNFRLTSDNGNDAGAAADTAWHTWRIEVGASTTEWFIDGASQGTITTETDVWPACLIFYRGATGNQLFVAWARVYYK